MPRKSKNAKTFGKTTEYPYPSRYGSHASMVVECHGEYVICEDERGRYATRESVLDNGMSDGWRWGTLSFRRSNLQALEETGKIPDDTST